MRQHSFLTTLATLAFGGTTLISGCNGKIRCPPNLAGYNIEPEARGVLGGTVGYANKRALENFAK